MNLKEIDKCLAGERFHSADPEILDIIQKARKLTSEYNGSPYESVTRTRILQQLLGTMGENIAIDTPFYCDYGRHIHLGNNVIIGMNCTFVDCNIIQIGSNVLIASHVQIYTATHPVKAEDRLKKDWNRHSKTTFFETYARPVHIQDNCWIGGGVIILPGVSIGKNSVVGAGSVVTKSIPDNCLAFGNPCRIHSSL